MIEVKRRLGDRLAAIEITGRNLQIFTEEDDIEWAVITHVVESPTNQLPDEVTGVIMTGNEDCPESIWVTDSDHPNHINTQYTLVGGTVTE